MKWPRKRFLLLTYFVLLTVFVTIGCTSKEDPSETLTLCGNHSCGDLVMVTTDTSSDGYHYLNPTISPDGSRILFSADWWALPYDPHYSGDEQFVNHRQMCVIPVQAGIEPAINLVDQGAELIRLHEYTMPIGGQIVPLTGVHNFDKSAPIWMDDTNVIFSLAINRGNRLFKADVSNVADAYIDVLYMEPEDAENSGPRFQHMEPALSPDGQWLAFTRSNCVIPDSFETCSQLAINILQMSTAGDNYGYDAIIFPVTSEVSRVETPRWSPDGNKLIFSAGLDMDGDTGVGTELYTIDFDTTGLATGTVELDRNLNRLTYTTYTEGNPISGIFNYSPAYSQDMSEIYFVSTRRAPSLPYYIRNLWSIPADGSLDPEIYFFTRSDDVDPTVNADGSIVFSSQIGFPTDMLDRLEEEAYQRIEQQNDQDETGFTEVQMRNMAAGERRLLELYQDVMSHMYIFRR